MKMDSEIVKVLEEIDKEICLNHGKRQKKNVYKYYNNSYIKNAKWPFGVYRRLGTYSDVRIFPDMNIKKWGAFGLNILRIKKESAPFTKLIGPLFAWFLLPKKTFNLSADIVVDKKKGRIIVLIYNFFNEVLKIRPLQSSTEKEAERTRRAKKSVVAESNVDIPTILHENHENGSFFVQELIQGKSLNSLSAQIKKDNYDILSEFLYKLYIDNGIQLISVPIKNVEVLSIIEDSYSKSIHLLYLEVLESCIDIQGNDRLCLLGYVHSDIHDGNLLLDKEDKLWVIDWQNAREDFLVVDLERLPEGNLLFDKIINLFPLQQEMILDFKNQRIIQRFSSINRRILRRKINEKKLEGRLKDIKKLRING